MVAPSPEKLGEPSNAAPLVRAATGPPLTSASKTCCAVRCAAWNTIPLLSGVHTRSPPPPSPPPGGTTRSSKPAVRLRGAPPAAGTTHRYSLVYHSVLFASCDTNAIHLPSGDHAGSASVPLRRTRSVGAPPAALTM